MIRRVLLLLATLLMAMSLAAGQARKSAVVNFDSDAPYEHWKWGHINFKINGQVKSFGWGDKTRFHNNTHRNAHKRGAIWKIIYGPHDGELYLWDATFTGRLAK